MDLRIYNTKSKQIEAFIPLKAPSVSMYACGPTVYDYTHIGHMRKYIGDDIIKRTLMYLGYDVTHVMNITDVGHLTDDGDNGEDKFEKGARKEGKTVWDIAQFYTEYFNRTMEAIGVTPPSVTPRATDHIAEMIALITTLFEKGFAYETSTAVYFDVSKDPTYGSLSGQSLEDKIVAHREDVVTDPEKRNPSDFVLWFKRVGKFADHSMHWPSPWGVGFPGWHIECSAMSMHYLGETIDIHTGGIDHIPVHHENEIAQSHCATDTEFVRYWIHHDFLMVDGEKMSKSKNNFYTLDTILEKGINPLAVRIMCMQTSYRKPLNFTWESLIAAETFLKKLQSFISKVENVGSVTSVYQQSFIEALCEDVNTAKALSLVSELLANPDITNEDKAATLISFDAILGLSLISVPKFTITPQAQDLVEKRNAARKEKDFETSDRLRKELEALGYEVLDTPEGTMLA